MSDQAISKATTTYRESKNTVLADGILNVNASFNTSRVFVLPLKRETCVTFIPALCFLETASGKEFLTCMTVEMDMESEPASASGMYSCRASSSERYVERLRTYLWG